MNIDSIRIKEPEKKIERPLKGQKKKARPPNPSLTINSESDYQTVTIPCLKALKKNKVLKTATILIRTPRLIERLNLIWKPKIAVTLISIESM